MTLAANRRRYDRGMTLLDVMMALFVLGIGLPALTFMFSVALAADSDNTTRTVAQFLANGLMSEISQRRFEYTSSQRGNTQYADELVSGSYDRRGFQAIGAYNIFSGAWANTPPRDEAGNLLTNFSQFTVWGSVKNINAPTLATALDLTAMTDGTTDTKLVTLMVSWNNSRSKVIVEKVFFMP